MILLRVRRGFGTTNGTFSCRFEEIGHKVSWDAILLIIRFLVFEFEIIFILFTILDRRLFIFILIVYVMVYEVKIRGFRL